VNNLSPKVQFQRDEELKKELATVVQSDRFHTALSFALSEFVFRGNPSQEEVQGARKFVHVLMELPFADTPMPTFPVRQIDHSALDRTQPPQFKPQPQTSTK
jgi:hypothetical protein